MCKLQTQDVNFLLMHSCTQGSGTAVLLNLFFLLVFGRSVFKEIYFWLLPRPNVDDVFPRFSLSSL